jgi:mannosylglucosylglycerate synthase
MANHLKKIGFISTRIAGTDGVSLEIKKWCEVLNRNGFKCYFFAGELDMPPEKSFLAKEAHFEHPEVKKVQKYCFDRMTRPRRISKKIHDIKDQVKSKLYRFQKKFDLDLIIPENALAIPMHIPLGMAITEFIAETAIPAIAHHHDLRWERTRFLNSAVDDYLHMSFPPELPTLKHVVINSLAATELSYRVGISNVVIPNVYNFEKPPSGIDSYAKSLRSKIGLDKTDPFILHPTRVIPRKWIEKSVELVSMLKLKKPSLIISHASGDEGDDYAKHVYQYAKRLGVKILAIDNMVNSLRKKGKNNSFFTIGDVYKNADIIAYPTGYEGFGNAFLETIYFKKPIIINRYSIYIADIEPKGFDAIVFDNIITNETVGKVKELLGNPDRIAEIAEKNYELARKYFSYEVLEKKLLSIIHSF